ncbi:MAG: nascent polypeptide-associated complex protein [Euryarchaeota archaeon HGW-Euryarchaeota-1]|nr:MAG: nascent polypeptide-associated complex protein [Euryarchaeota archaeon HGW-Euryarchaeota-1]
MFNIDPRQMAKVMKQMGMEQEELEAEEVIIRTQGKNIIIKRPQVVKISMQGQESFQISGDIVEEENESKNSSIKDEDVDMVISQTGASEERARAKLEENKGDLAKTILEMKK